MVKSGITNYKPATDNLVLAPASKGNGVQPNKANLFWLYKHQLLIHYNLHMIF